MCVCVSMCVCVCVCVCFMCRLMSLCVCMYVCMYVSSGESALYIRDGDACTYFSSNMYKVVFCTLWGGSANKSAFVHERVQNHN